MTDTLDIQVILREVFAQRGYGITLRTGELPAIHTNNGSHTINDNVLSSHEIFHFLDQVMKSRERRELNKKGIVRFFGRFDEVRILVGARVKQENIVVEVRRMAEG